MKAGVTRLLTLDEQQNRFSIEIDKNIQPHSPAMGQKDGEKWTAAVDLQPTLPKSDSLLVTEISVVVTKIPLGRHRCVATLHCVF